MKTFRKTRTNKAFKNLATIREDSILSNEYYMSAGGYFKMQKINGFTNAVGERNAILFFCFKGAHCSDSVDYPKIMHPYDYYSTIFRFSRLIVVQFITEMGEMSRNSNIMRIWII